MGTVDGLDGRQGAWMTAKPEELEATLRLVSRLRLTLAAEVKRSDTRVRLLGLFVQLMAFDVATVRKALGWDGVNAGVRELARLGWLPYEIDCEDTEESSEQGPD